MDHTHIPRYLAALCIIAPSNQLTAAAAAAAAATKTTHEILNIFCPKYQQKHLLRYVPRAALDELSTMLNLGETEFAGNVTAAIQSLANQRSTATGLPKRVVIAIKEKRNIILGSSLESEFEIEFADSKHPEATTERANLQQVLENETARHSRKLATIIQDIDACSRKRRKTFYSIRLSAMLWSDSN